MGTDKIPVFIASDNHFAPLAAVAMASICNNTKSDVDFYLLDGGISVENKNQIKTLTSTFDNLSIEFIEIDVDKEFRNFATTDGITRSMYSRFLIPTLKPDINKAIYLDADVIALGDISRLWKENLENYPLGAVWSEYASRAWDKFILHLSDNYRYFNSGVLLIDCAKWRENNITEKLLILETQIKNLLRFPDMDILNKYFDGNYKILDKKYNMTTQQVLYDKLNGISIDDMVIRHFESNKKPWNSYYYKQHPIPYHEHFWLYTRLTPFYDSMMETFKISTENKTENETEKPESSSKRIYSNLRKKIKK
jgi:lipopolysaccharide biosynthesis glycosyltransferase